MKSLYPEHNKYHRFSFSIKQRSMKKQTLLLGSLNSKNNVKLLCCTSFLHITIKLEIDAIIYSFPPSQVYFPSKLSVVILSYIWLFTASKQFELALTTTELSLPQYFVDVFPKFLCQNRILLFKFLLVFGEIKMSIRTNKMKAVPVLLKQLMIARRKFHERGRDESLDKKLEKLRLDLNRIKDVFVRVKKKEEELLDTLAEVYGHLRKLDRGKLDEDMDGICKRIRDSARKLLPDDGFDESYKKEDEKGGKISHTSQELVQPHENKSWTAEDFYLLDDRLKVFLGSLQIFPENAVIRKRIAINLWIGEGLLENTESKTTEELGEDVISDLFKLNLIVRYAKGKSVLLANKFQILPSVRRQMGSYLLKKNVEHRGQYFIASIYLQKGPWRLQLEQNKVTLGDDLHLIRGIIIGSIFNIGASYLNFRLSWVTEFKNLEVFQLGRWQDSALHHIEVGSEEFLKELRYLKKLKYVSLRGISRIFELPSSIAELEKLLILDVKACHNLERLPDDISSMKSLTHLIMSDCCLLEGMPKGIEKLTNLEVLKGFLISTSEKTPCKISDLVKLGKLRRLSIRIGSEAEIRDGEFEGLKDFSALEHLKISWSVSDPKYANINVLLPSSLKKLHIECFPGKSLEECFMPGEYFPRKSLEECFMPGVHGRFRFILTELNITGGKLESMEVDFEWWRVKIVRLKYLKQLNVDIDDLKAMFPLLKYVEIKQVSNISYIQHEWDI
ncbi:uncharacterized protein LOC114186009 [Vigna unguiculata]|uniref:uncharacterized protein LOC114186009 n=1 Tax=Vigna unguiculata TaxID=3917 RepID=UPI001016442F|nr:uncharacterized protein LOC114186009 [Vigna unguiculata]